eukprot:6725722-Prymnesium_polylepis.2
MESMARAAHAAPPPPASSAPTDIESSLSASCESAPQLAAAYAERATACTERRRTTACVSALRAAWRREAEATSESAAKPTNAGCRKLSTSCASVPLLPCGPKALTPVTPTRMSATPR